MVYQEIRIWLIGLMFFLSYETIAQSKWVVDKDEDGIIIYTRYEKGSAFKSFKAVMTVEASIDEIIGILRDADNYTKWYGYTKSSKLLKLHENEQYNYVETNFPWPYQNRDMVYKMSIDSLKEGLKKIHLTGLPNYIPENTEIVRMQKAEGYMLLEPVNERIEITYVFHSDPGENIPSWLANKSISELPYKTLSGLRTALKDR